MAPDKTYGAQVVSLTQSLAPIAIYIPPCDPPIAIHVGNRVERLYAEVNDACPGVPALLRLRLAEAKVPFLLLPLKTNPSFYSGKTIFTGSFSSSPYSSVMTHTADLDALFTPNQEKDADYRAILYNPYVDSSTISFGNALSSGSETINEAAIRVVIWNAKSGKFIGYSEIMGGSIDHLLTTLAKGLAGPRCALHNMPILFPCPSFTLLRRLPGAYYSGSLADLSSKSGSTP
jgi:hypothetical protein